MARMNIVLLKLSLFDATQTPNLYTMYTQCIHNVYTAVSIATLMRRYFFDALALTQFDLLCLQGKCHCEGSRVACPLSCVTWIARHCHCGDDIQPTYDRRRDLQSHFRLKREASYSYRLLGFLSSIFSLAIS